MDRLTRKEIYKDIDHFEKTGETRISELTSLHLEEVKTLKESRINFINGFQIIASIVIVFLLANLIHKSIRLMLVKDDHSKEFFAKENRSMAAFLFFLGSVFLLFLSGLLQSSKTSYGKDIEKIEQHPIAYLYGTNV